MTIFCLTLVVVGLAGGTAVYFLHLAPNTNTPSSSDQNRIGSYRFQKLPYPTGYGMGRAYPYHTSAVQKIQNLSESPVTSHVVAKICGEISDFYTFMTNDKFEIYPH